MPPSKHFQQLAHCCNHVASEISDKQGFVSIQSLVTRFGAKLIVRPILVEGMLASSENGTPSIGGNKHQWTVIIDEETHKVSEEDIKSEKYGLPLSPRFRNTVAHELAHSLAFRPTEFGVEHPKQFKTEKSKREFVEQIEKETEKLSPLLLIPDCLLDKVFAANKQAIEIEDLCDLRSSAGVSRSLIVNRLNLLSYADVKRLKTLRPSLQKIAIGIGEWKSKTEATLNSFPLFSTLSGEKLPAFIFQLQRRADCSANNIFTDPNFLLCGGDSNKTECLIPAGTLKHPMEHKIMIRCSVEKSPQRAGAEFLFMIQSLA